MIQKKAKMLNHNDRNDRDKPPPITFIHYIFKMALDEIHTLSDRLRAIQPSKYEDEKDTIATLAFLIHEKVRNIRGLMGEMSKEKRSIALGDPISREMEESPLSMDQLESKNRLLKTTIRRYEKETKKKNAP
jgi:hypothetical protein